jgi:hypothetical protein
MSPLEIGLNTTMDEILRVYPSAKLGLFRRYHIGGCTACGYQLTDTLGEVMREHSITDSLEKVIECIRESQEVETRLQILPMTVVLARSCGLWTCGHGKNGSKLTFLALGCSPWS